MAIKHLITLGYGFADDTKFIPTIGFTPGAAISLAYVLCIDALDVTTPFINAAIMTTPFIDNADVTTPYIQAVQVGCE